MKAERPACTLCGKRIKTRVYRHEHDAAIRQRKELEAENATLRAEVEHWKARADMRWSQQDLDNAKRDGERIHTIAEQRQRITALETELRLAFARAANNAACHAAKVEAARREEREAVIAMLEKQARDAWKMADDWMEGRPENTPEHRGWTARATDLEDAIAAIRDRGTGPDTTEKEG